MGGLFNEKVLIGRLLSISLGVMAFSLVNTLPASSSRNDVFTYLLDTFLPTVGWTTASHPDTSSTKRVANRSYTNQLTGSTLTNYFWVNWTSSTNYAAWHKDSSYTTVPGDAGNNTTNRLDFVYSDTPYSSNNLKFWTNSAKPNASLVTRGKYIIWCDFGVTDVFAYDDNGWTGAGNSNATTFFPFNYSFGALKFATAPSFDGNSTLESWLIPNHEGQSIATPAGVDSIIKGWDMTYGNNSINDRISGIAYRLSGDEIVLHVPANGADNNHTQFSPGVVVQNGSDYYLRFSSDMTQVSPMLNMGTSEPDFN